MKKLLFLLFPLLSKAQKKTADAVDCYSQATVFILLTHDTTILGNATGFFMVLTINYT